MDTKLALVTGGAQRIGAAICRELHAAGYNLALHYRRSKEAAQALADELNQQRADSCRLYQAELSSVDEIQTMAGQLMADSAHLDLLVNNASSFEPTPLASSSESDFDDMLGTNLKGPYFLIQQLLPALRQAEGNIVNILDVHAQRPLAGFSAYCAAKAGLASLTRSLALELAPAIRANGVAPGAILWPGEEAEFDEKVMHETIERTPLGRLGEPEDIAKAVRFLATEAPFITGQVLAVDGGRTLPA